MDTDITQLIAPFYVVGCIIWAACALVAYTYRGWRSGQETRAYMQDLRRRQEEEAA